MVRTIRFSFISICLFAGLVGLSSGNGPTVYLIDFNDVVHGVSADFVIEAIKQANETNAELIIIQMQTPGGMSNSMELMIQNILASEVPVVGFVAPSGAKAASAGFYILMACDVAVMAPGTRSGAATPVTLTGGGEDNENYKRLMKKAERDSRAYLRTLVRGRLRMSVVPADAEASEIGEERIQARMEEAVNRAMAAIDDSEAYTEKEAEEYGLIDFTAASVEEILERLDGVKIRRFALDEESKRFAKVNLAGAEITRIEMDMRQQFLSYLSNPLVALLLGTVGVIGLYIEFTNPGLILPGAVGVICLVLASIAFQILPVNWAGLLLIGIALFLFVLEFKIASYGLLTVGGIICLIFGALMLFEGPIPELRLDLWQVVPFAIAFAGITLFLLQLVIKAHLGKVETGKQGLVGERGKMKNGKIFVHGELWDVADTTGLEEGDEVEVQAIDRMLLKVKKV